MVEANETILVTGATGGIRQPCAIGSREPDTIVLAARDASRLEALSEACPGTHSWISVDMSSDGPSPASPTPWLPGAYRAGRGGSDAATTACDERCLRTMRFGATSSRTASSVPLALLKAAMATMKPDPANGKRCSGSSSAGISSVQVLGHYATSNVVRCAWLAEAKTLAFALGEQGIHVNTLSLRARSPWYRAGLEERAAGAGHLLRGASCGRDGEYPAPGSTAHPKRSP